MNSQKFCGPLSRGYGLQPHKICVTLELGIWTHESPNLCGSEDMDSEPTKFLHANTCILLHFTQFMVRRQKRYQPYSPWEYIPNFIWRKDKAPEVAERDDDTYLCQVCGKTETWE